MYGTNVFFCLLITAAGFAPVYGGNGVSTVYHGVEAGVRFGTELQGIVIYQISYEPEYRFLAGITGTVRKPGISRTGRNALFVGYRRYLLDNLFLEYRGNLQLPDAIEGGTVETGNAGCVWSDIVAGVRLHRSAFPVYCCIQYLLSLDAALRQSTSSGAPTVHHWNSVTHTLEVAAGLRW